jgi:hypothetical protein
MSDIQQVTVLDSLSQELLHLPIDAIRHVGPAAQTLAGLLSITRTQTFVAIDKIAKRSWLPLRTAKYHLRQLQDDNWVKNCGRQKSSSGGLIRTSTLQVTQKALQSRDKYFMLPWWSCCQMSLPDGSVERLSWGSRVLLAMLTTKLAIAKNSYNPGVTSSPVEDSAFWCYYADHGRHEDFAISLKEIHEKTNLTTPTITAAKRQLSKIGVIGCQKGSARDDADTLELQQEFSVTSTSDGGRYQITLATPSKNLALVPTKKVARAPVKILPWGTKNLALTH